MVRTLRDAKLDSPSGRAKLSASPEPYWLPMGKHRAIGYAKPRKGAGTWRARFYHPGTRSFTKTSLGLADDYQLADGLHVFTFEQAQEKAGKWFEGEADAVLEKATGEAVRRTPYTVAIAMKDYLKDAERRGVKGVRIMTLTSDAHIIPALGEHEVSKLTKPKLDDWLHSLAEAPRRKTGRPRKEGEEVEHLEAPTTENERRARKDSANRIMTNLCAALNLALRNGRVKCKPVWKDVERFKNVGAARVHFLSVEEQRRLVNVCPPGFRELVQAALFSGCRYGELCRLTVRDFDPKAETLFIDKSKSGKPRHITLTEEAVKWFKVLVAGKPAGAKLFTRPNAKGKKRKGMDDPFAWGPHDQKKAMVTACTNAKIDAIGFHELRHTYASGLVNAGVPLAFVAAQLGHIDTSMVEKHYGHLCPTAKAEAIRKLAPKLGIGQKKPKVEALKLKKA